MPPFMLADNNVSASFGSVDDDCISVISSTSNFSGEHRIKKGSGIFHKLAGAFKANGASGPSKQERKKNAAILAAKEKVITSLSKVEGDVTDKNFLKNLDKLVDLYDPSQFDARIKTSKKKDAAHLGGTWIALSKPTFSSCVGHNEADHPMYTLGTLSFDMFSPGKLVCSVQGCFNPVHTVSRKDREAIQYVPKSLKEEVLNGSTVLRSYDIVTALTVESKHDPIAKQYANKSVKDPIRGLFTMNGYVLPDPEKPNRLVSWFTGGTLEMDDPNKTLDDWKKVFDDLGRTELQAKAKRLAAWLAMGAEPAQAMGDDGKMEFSFTSPMDGCYIDVLYLDETLRIMKAKSGTIFVFCRN